MVTSDSQSARPIHPLVSIWCKLLEESICEWLLTNRTSFWPILKLSHALDGLFSVLSRLHGCKHKCTFCRMKHHWTWFDYFQLVLLGILSSMEPTFYFQIQMKMLWWPHPLSVLSVDCTECSCSPNTVIFNDFLVFNFPFFNFEQFPSPWISILSSFSMLYSTIN